MKRRLGAMVCVCALTSAEPALAQSYVLGGQVDVGSGLEVGGLGRTYLRRSRTRLRLGGDVRVDESPETIWAVGILAELEPRTSVGFDVRFVREWGRRIVLNAGVIGYVVPATMFGVIAGGQYRLPLAKGVEFRVGPEFDIFVAGGDLPDKAILVQAIVVGGVHVDL
jgi:hypothetical protein